MTGFLKEVRYFFRSASLHGVGPLIWSRKIAETRLFNKNENDEQAQITTCKMREKLKNEQHKSCGITEIIHIKSLYTYHPIVILERTPCILLLFLTVHQI